MKTLLYTLVFIALVSCEKDKITEPKAELVKCGTLRINSDGGPFRYQLGTSNSIYFTYITSDTIFDIYENSLYRIYYKGTTIASIDSIWFNEGGNTGPKTFIRIDTTYDYHILEHQTETGPQSFDDVLPSTVFDR